MAVLSSVYGLAAVASDGITVFADFPWALLLNVAMGGIGFYALRIIILTVCLKLILFPLDLFQRYKMRKNQLIMVRIKPQLEKLQQVYGNNPQVLQKKQAELNRREGMSYLSSCLPMIVTMIVFIWLWQSLLATAQYKQFDNYITVYNIYSSAYTEVLGDNYDASTDSLSANYAKDYRVEFDTAFSNNYEYSSDWSETDKQAAIKNAVTSATVSAGEKYTDNNEYFALYVTTYADTFSDFFATIPLSYTEEQAVSIASEAAANKAAESVVLYSRTAAQNDVYDYYYSLGKYADGNGYKSDSFLWIKDIWYADVPWANSLASTQADFESAIGSYGTDPAKSGLSDAELEKVVGLYSTVMARVISEGEYGTNGYLVLPILAVALNLTLQLIMRRQQKKSGQDLQAGQNSGCLKAMVFIMPFIMGFFALTYCAAFTLYMVTNSLMSLIINLVSTKISNKLVPISGAAVSKGSTVSRYGRPDPNAKSPKK